MSQGARIDSKATPPKPVLTFSWLAWEKIWKLTTSNREGTTWYELTSMGIMDPKDPYRVLDIYVPKQRNSGSATNVDDEDLQNWLVHLRTLGIKSQQLTLWHHSHADMGVFWSQTDMDNIKRYESDGIQWSVVTNKRGEILIRADMFSPIRYWWDDCDYVVQYPDMDLKDWYEGVKPSITNMSYSAPSSGSYAGAYGSNWSTDWKTKNAEGATTTVDSKKNQEVIDKWKEKQAEKQKAGTTPPALEVVKEPSVVVDTPTAPEVKAEEKVASPGAERDPFKYAHYLIEEYATEGIITLDEAEELDELYKLEVIDHKELTIRLAFHKRQLELIATAALEAYGNRHGTEDEITGEFALPRFGFDERFDDASDPDGFDNVYAFGSTHGRNE